MIEKVERRDRTFFDTVPLRIVHFHEVAVGKMLRFSSRDWPPGYTHLEDV